MAKDQICNKCNNGLMRTPQNKIVKRIKQKQKNEGTITEKKDTPDSHDKTYLQK